jgi:hypothetical protein
MTRPSLILTVLLATPAILLTACGPMEPAEQPLASDAGPQLSSQAGGGATSLSLSASTVTAGAALTATVSAGSGAVVYLGFPRGVLAGPQFVRIPAGRSSATFALVASPYVAAATTVSVTAMTTTPNPASFLATSLTVAPAVAPAGPRLQVAALALSPASVPSGATSTATLTLTGPAPAGGAAVQVWIANDFFGQDADAPAVVVVPAGASSAAFAVPTHLSSGYGTVGETLVASHFGGAIQGAVLTVVGP